MRWLPATPIISFNYDCSWTTHSGKTERASGQQSTDTASFRPSKVHQHGVWSAASPPTVDEELTRRAGDVLCGPERSVPERSGDIGDVVPETSVTGAAVRLVLEAF
jgi:hypothetical protein